MDTLLGLVEIIDFRPLKIVLGILVKIVGIKFGGNGINFYFCGDKICFFGL